MQTRDFDYYLPAELIAQQPATERTAARLMLVSRSTGAIKHYHVSDLPSLLKQGDLMVLNNTRVIPARVFGKKQKTGGKVEVLFIEENRKNFWEAFLHSSGRPRPGDMLLLANDKIKAQVNTVGAHGRVVLEISGNGDFQQTLAEEGLPPLPPYIKRPKNEQSTATGRRQIKIDQERYQTVYARVPGAIAAPTAGLHFSSELLAALEKAGVQRTEITLHVGPGTFIPVRCDQIESHKMEPEHFIIAPAAARIINQAIAARRRIVAVGTTMVRALESAVNADGKIVAGSGRTDIFIYPPCQFRAIGALLTNFHLPRSTLLMLVSAFACRELILAAYATAVREKYRFYSYGDCMLIV